MIFVGLKYQILKRVSAFFIVISLILSPSVGYAQAGLNQLNLPVPGTMVGLSQPFVPVLLKGMTIHPDQPLKLDFIIDSGHTNFDQEQLKRESEPLVKYFLASLTVPKDDLWVNLSPYEQDRIIPDELGKTTLGRDLLAQDYFLKQLSSSLLYPESELGKKFWSKVRRLAKKQFGITDIPVNTFNKVWIMPESASVYEHERTVYVTDAKLKIMLDQDYSAQKSNLNPDQKVMVNIIREIILPVIEQEINEGKGFAPLRQIYHSLILAKWYKKTVKNSLLSKVYIDQNKTTGIEENNQTFKDQIYDRYLQAYKKGVYNYIKEEYDTLSRMPIPKKYFSGGFTDASMTIDRASLASTIVPTGESFGLSISVIPEIDSRMKTDHALMAGQMIQSEHLPFDDPDSVRRQTETRGGRRPHGEPDGVKVVAQAEPMVRVLRRVDRMANSANNTPILIKGKTGTGKKLIWQLLHYLDPVRKNQDPIVININQLSGSEDSLRQELASRFAEAPPNATIILDGLEGISKELQGLLLDVLENGVFHVSGGKDIHLENVQFVATQNNPINQPRDDFLHRFTRRIELPTLEDRPGDRVLIFEYFNHKISVEEGIEWHPLSMAAGFLLEATGRTISGEVRGIERLVQKVLEPRLDGEEEERHYTTIPDLVKAGVELKLPQVAANKTEREIRDVNGVELWREHFGRMPETALHDFPNQYLELVHGDRPFFGLSMPADELARIERVKQVSVDRRDAEAQIERLNRWFADHLAELPKEIKSWIMRMDENIQAVRLGLGEQFPNGEYAIKVVINKRDPDGDEEKHEATAITSMEHDGLGLWVAVLSQTTSSKNFHLEISKYVQFWKFVFQRKAFYWEDDKDLYRIAKQLGLRLRITYWRDGDLISVAGLRVQDVVIETGTVKFDNGLEFRLMDRVIKTVEIDDAMGGEVDEAHSDVGGIDMNEIGFERQGGGITIEFDPASVAPFLNMDIQGFGIGEIQLTPIMNLPMVLGIKEENESGEKLGRI